VKLITPLFLSFFPSVLASPTQETMSARTVAVQGSGWGWLVCLFVCFVSLLFLVFIADVLFCNHVRATTNRKSAWKLSLARTRTPCSVRVF
jgi:hypothetical protein